MGDKRPKKEDTVPKGRIYDRPRAMCYIYPKRTDGQVISACLCIFAIDADRTVSWSPVFIA
jgi:hypothetical protein